MGIGNRAREWGLGIGPGNGDSDSDGVKNGDTNNDRG